MSDSVRLTQCVFSTLLVPALARANPPFAAAEMVQLRRRLARLTLADRAELAAAVEALNIPPGGAVPRSPEQQRAFAKTKAANDAVDWRVAQGIRFCGSRLRVDRGRQRRSAPLDVR